MSEAITRAVAEAIRIAIQTMVEAQVERMHDGSGPKVDGPTMKQPTFDWNAQDKYSKLKTFRLEVNNILSTYNTPQTDKLTLVKNWLGRKGLQYLETLTTAEKHLIHWKAYSKHYLINLNPNIMKWSSRSNSEK